MRATYSRIRDEEEAKRGLVIVKALYGKIAQGTIAEDLNGETERVDHECTEVTIPLQCLVKDSKLVLHDHSKVINVSQILFV